ncbi:hypothetical protein P7C71_g5772, partial [Lecanoromycetidae sp. Uapishka_2]
MFFSKLPQRHQDGLTLQRPRFPSQQLFILALCRICEPIAFMSIFPYVYYMILSFNITSDTRQIAIYVGMVTSAFAFAEFSSGVAWGRISDRIGRKPVLLTGLAGTALSMLVFGFAPSLPVALLGRALGGLLNGNMGVLQTTVAEIVTVKEHQRKLDLWIQKTIKANFEQLEHMQSCHSSGVLGGALAQPSKSFPAFFPRGSFFDRYPFLLPNLVCAVVLAFGVLIGILFLEETHAGRKHRRDYGLEAGQWLLNRFNNSPAPLSTLKAGEMIEDYNTVAEDDEPPPGYRTTEGSPRLPSSRSQSPGATRDDVNLLGERVTSPPSLLVLGVINGAAASTASLARACGPTVTGILHSWGLEIGSTGVAWWASGIICLLGAFESMWLEEGKGRMYQPDPNDEDRSVEEALIDPLALDAAINAAGDFPDHSENWIKKSDSKVAIR